MSMLFLLLAGLGIALFLLIVNHDSGSTMGMSNDDFATMVKLSAIASLLAVSFLAGRRGAAGEMLRNIAIWLFVALLLVGGYLYRDDAAAIGTRLLAGLNPGRAVVTTASDGVSEVVLHKSLGGHFSTHVSIDGRDIPMMVDTGASSVVLSYEDAAAIGLKPADLDFSVSVSTANGRTMAAPIRLGEVAIGPIVRRNVRALVADRGRLETSLLGMTFLSTLDSLQIRSDELRLRD